LRIQSLPIVGQYFDCRPHHHSASLLEFGFILLASLLPIFTVSVVEVAAGSVTSMAAWSGRFAPELAIASSCMVAPLMYFFVSPARLSAGGERTDFPHKGSLQLVALIIFSAGMLLYVIFACLKYFREDAADAVKSLFYTSGTIIYFVSLAITYTAVLFKNFADNPEVASPDEGVDAILADLGGGE
jgi:hypothetical protein